MKLFVKLKLIVVIFITCGVFGCASVKIDSIPLEKSQFEIDKSELKKMFSDIERYEYKLLPTETPYIQDLVDKWDEPMIKKKDWISKGITYSIFVGGAFLTPTGAIAAAAVVIPIWPVPNEYYYWNKGNYCVEAYTEKNMINLYKPTLLYWTWYELNNDENIPKECKKSLN